MPESAQVSVVMSTTHEATRRMAKVLHRQGLLQDFLVPFEARGLVEAAKRFGPLGRPVAHGLQAWVQDPPAVSGAPIPELASALGFRVLGNHQRFFQLQRIIQWRVRTMERSLRKRVSLNPPAAVVSLQSFNRSALAAIAPRGVQNWLIANSAVWALDSSLAALAESTPPGPLRDEIRAERALQMAAEHDRDIARAHGVIVESDFMAEYARSRVRPGAPIVVVGQAIDPTVFVPAGRDYSARPLRIAQVSRITHGKGLTAANEAARIAAAAIESWRVIGWESERSPLLAKSCPNLKLVGGGPQSRVVRELQRADVKVLPTLGDSMPRAVLEAMACGLPVITTDLSGYTEVIRDGENGFIVPANDAGAIAAVLVRLSEDGELRQRVGLAARATAEQHTWEAVEARFTEGLYSKLLPSLRAER